MKLIKSAFNDTRIFGRCIARWHFFCRGGRLRRGLRLRGWSGLRASLSPAGRSLLEGYGRSRRCRLIGAAMRDEFIIAWSPGPRRRVFRQTPGPMRPMVGHIARKLTLVGTAGARRKCERQTKRVRHRNKAPYVHVVRCAAKNALSLHRPQLTILSGAFLFDALASH
jgi:hypothetical protein